MLRPSKKLGRRGRRGDRKRNAKKKIPILVPLPAKLMPLIPLAKLRRRTPLELSATIIAKQVIIPKTLSNLGWKTLQKTNISLGNLRVDKRDSSRDYIIVVCPLHLIPDSVLEEFTSSSLDRFQKEDKCNNPGLCNKVWPYHTKNRHQLKQDQLLIRGDIWDRHSRFLAPKYAGKCWIPWENLFVGWNWYIGGPGNAFPFFI